MTIAGFRIIVEFAAPPVPDAANFESADAADAAHIGERSMAFLDEIPGPCIFASGRSSGWAASDELHLKRMDFSPMFALTVGQRYACASGRRPGQWCVFTRDGPRSVDLNMGSPQLLGTDPDAGRLHGRRDGEILRRVAILDTGGRRTHEFLSSRIISAACYGTNNAGQGSSATVRAAPLLQRRSMRANDCDASTIRRLRDMALTFAGTAAGFNTSLSSGETPPHGVGVTAGYLDQTSSRGLPMRGLHRQRLSALSNGCVLTWNSDQILGLKPVYALRNTYNIDAVNMSLGGGQYFSHCDTDSRKQIIDLLRGAGIATVICGRQTAATALQSARLPAFSSAITVASFDQGRCPFKLLQLGAH